MPRSIFTTRLSIPAALLMIPGLLIGLAPAPATAGASVPTTEVSIDDDREITMDTTLEPGPTAFHVTSTKNSTFQLAVRAAGYTKRELSKDVNNAFNKGDVKAMKRFERNVVLLGGVSSSPDEMGMMTATLPDEPSGTLMAIDTNSNFTPGRILDLTIEGEPTLAAAPFDATIRAKGATKWAGKPATISREGTLRFVNGATQNHFMEMAKLKKGKTFEDWRQWIRKVKRGERAKPPVSFDKGLTTGVLSPSQEMTFDYALPKGNYVLTCFWPDASMGGMPHAFMGMSRPVKVVAGE